MFNMLHDGYPRWYTPNERCSPVGSKTRQRTSVVSVCAVYVCVSFWMRCSPEVHISFVVYLGRCSSLDWGCLALLALLLDIQNSFWEYSAQKPGVDIYRWKSTKHVRYSLHSSLNALDGASAEECSFGTRTYIGGVKRHFIRAKISVLYELNWVGLNGRMYSAYTYRAREILIGKRCNRKLHFLNVCVHWVNIYTPGLCFAMVWTIWSNDIVASTRGRF